MRRRTRLLAVLPVLGLAAVAACQPFHAGAAATVGNHRISTKQLRQESQRQTEALAALPAGALATNAPPSDQAVQRTVLSDQIRLAVLEQYATSKGITVGAEQIAAERAILVAGLGVSDALAPGAEVLNHDDLGLESQITAYEKAIAATLPASSAAIEQAYESSSDHEEVRAQYAFILSTGDNASQLAARLPSATPATFGALVQGISGAAPTPAAWTPANVFEQYVPASALKPGHIVGPVTLQSQDGSQTAYLVINVLAVRTVTPAAAQLPGSLQRQAVQSAQMAALLGTQEKRLGIHVSPRFGAWTFTSAQQVGSVGGLPPSQQLSLDTGFDASQPSTSGS